MVREAPRRKAALRKVENDPSFSRCFRCGICCKYGVSLTLEEAEGISDYTGLPIEAFTRKLPNNRIEVTVNSDPWFGEGCDDTSWFEPVSFTLSRRDGTCFFLEGTPGAKEFLCQIHSVKPKPCQNYTPGVSHEACREGLTRYWGLFVGESGNLSGTGKNRREFRTFLERLSDGK